jgi:hypothetical protein
MLWLSNIKKVLCRLPVLSLGSRHPRIPRQVGMRGEIEGTDILKRLNQISGIVPEVVDQRRYQMHLHEVGRIWSEEGTSVWQDSSTLILIA